MRTAQEMRAQIDQQLHPNGFNVGENVGTAGRQTINQARLQLTPRCLENVPDPKDGIRWLIPERARYWADEGPGARQ